VNRPSHVHRPDFDQQHPGFRACTITRRPTASGSGFRPDEQPFSARQILQAPDHYLPLSVFQVFITAMNQIAKLNHRRATEFERSEDRPDSRTAAPGQRMSLDQKRARDRLRTASWRCHQDKLKRPEASVIGMALLKAVCTASAEAFDADSKSILGNALLDLHKRGFSLTETKEVMRRLRIRYRTEGEKKTLLAGKPETD
jgi:hypothetical protein